MCGGVFAHVVDDTEQLRRKITVRKTPLEPVGSSGGFSNIIYPDSFIAFQWHYAMSEINKHKLGSKNPRNVCHLLKSAVTTQFRVVSKSPFK